MRLLIYSAIIVRIVSQVVVSFIPNDSIAWYPYAIGVGYFELVSIYVFTKVLSSKDLMLNFALGLCLFDLFKFLFLSPFTDSAFEYINILMGFIFILVRYIYDNHKKDNDVIKGRAKKL